MQRVLGGPLQGADNAAATASSAGRNLCHLHGTPRTALPTFSTSLSGIRIGTPKLQKISKERYGKLLCEAVAAMEPDVAQRGIAFFCEQFWHLCRNHILFLERHYVS
jgi:hypothetical protein